MVAPRLSRLQTLRPEADFSQPISSRTREESRSQEVDMSPWDLPARAGTCSGQCPEEGVPRSGVVQECLVLLHSPHGVSRSRSPRGVAPIAGVSVLHSQQLCILPGMGMAAEESSFPGATCGGALPPGSSTWQCPSLPCCDQAPANNGVLRFSGPSMLRSCTFWFGLILRLVSIQVSLELKAVYFLSLQIINYMPLYPYLT